MALVIHMIAVSSLVALVSCGYIGAPAIAYNTAPAYASPALVSQQSNILRTPGNLGQVSTYSKTINTPYSSVSKSDVRVSNDALAYPASPALEVHHAAPYTYSARPVHHATPIAPITGPVAPPPGYSARPVPVASGTAVAPAGSLIGVAYSAAPVVSHMTYSNGLGISYAYK